MQEVEGSTPTGGTCLNDFPDPIGETGASWSENCIFVNVEDIIHLRVLLSHCVTIINISLTYSLVFHLENDRF